jgi:protein Mpv17
MAAFDNFVAGNPLLFATAFATTKNTSADLLIQTQVECRDTVDWRRVTTFAAFGTIWVGAGQYAIFNKFIPWAFPGVLAGKFIPAMKGVAFDQLIHMPLLYLPIFYTIREFAYGTESFNMNYVEGGLKSWKNNLIEDTVAQWSIFVPLQCFNFTLVPPHFRVPVMISAGFFWVMGLSFFRGNPNKDTKQNSS